MSSSVLDRVEELIRVQSAELTVSSTPGQVFKWRAVLTEKTESGVKLSSYTSNSLSDIYGQVEEKLESGEEFGPYDQEFYGDDPEIFDELLLHDEWPIGHDDDY